jgi:hypothetical protein
VRKASAPSGLDETVRILPFGQEQEGEQLAVPGLGQADLQGAPAALRPALSPSKQKMTAVGEAQQLL